MEIERRFKMRSVSKTEINHAIRDLAWQEFRATLHYVPLLTRLDLLEQWMNGGATHEGTMRHVQVINYINALKRGGMVK